mmetsp:Transcript_23308/g.56525  ORF Transcript_23308/g.56525 Transcript_23308/m.56525 type:complete len:260 (-) Transcript_23308:63-842(-)
MKKVALDDIPTVMGTAPLTHLALSLQAVSLATALNRSDLYGKIARRVWNHGKPSPGLLHVWKHNLSAADFTLTRNPINPSAQWPPVEIKTSQEVPPLIACDGSLTAANATFAVVIPKENFSPPAVPASGNWDDCDRKRISSMCFVIKGSIDNTSVLNPNVGDAETVALAIATSISRDSPRLARVYSDSITAITSWKAKSTYRFNPYARKEFRRANRQLTRIMMKSNMTPITVLKVNSHATSSAVEQLIHSLADYNASEK